MNAEENTDPADAATLEVIREKLVETFEAGFIVVCREENGRGRIDSVVHCLLFLLTVWNCLLASATLT